VQDLKGGTVGVVGIKTATDLWARAGLINAGLVPDKDTKVVPMTFPAIGDAVRTGKVSAGTFVEPFYSAEVAKGGLRKLFTATEAVGYDHELLDIFFGEKFLKANPDAVRAFLADYVAVTKYYLANTAQAKADLHKAGFVRTPLEIYLKNARLEARSERARRRRKPEEAVRFHAGEAAVARETGERRLDGRPELPAAVIAHSPHAHSPHADARASRKWSAKNNDVLPGQVADRLLPFQGVNRGGFPAHLGFGHGVQGLDRHGRIVSLELDEYQTPGGLEGARNRGQHLVRVFELMVDVHHQRKIEVASGRRGSVLVPSIAFTFRGAGSSAAAGA
jgi:hypothetical protein